MSKRSFLPTALLALAGCTGAGLKPMPERLAPEQQQAHDYGWAHLVALGPQVERTALLDAILTTSSWHSGVDRLYLYSTTWVGRTQVVMETHFDRALPDQDSFTVTFLDEHDRVLRRDAFTPAELDDAICLYMTPEGDIPDETPEALEIRVARLAEKNARLQRVTEVFPQLPEAVDGVPEPPALKAQR